MEYLFQELVDDLFRTFGTPATLLDAQDRVLAFSDQPPELADPLRRRVLLVNDAETEIGRAVLHHVNDAARRASGIVRIPAAPHLELYERLVIPLRIRTSATAFVYLIDPHRRVTPEALEPFSTAFDAVAKQVELHRLARHQVRAAVAGLASSDDDERRLAVSTLDERSNVRWRAPLCSVVITGDAPVRNVPDGYWTRLLGHDGEWTELAGRIVAILGNATPARLAELADGIASAPLAAGRPVLAAGVGEAVDRLSELSRSYRQAVRALRFAQSTVTDSPVASWSTLGAWRTVLALEPDDARESVDPRVRRMTTNEPAAVLSMLRSYLEREADVEEIATAHHLHRTTLYARFRRLQERYGLRWEHGEDRFAAALGIRIAQLYDHTGEQEPAPADPALGTVRPG
jgi:hypothetical protein